MSTSNKFAVAGATGRVGRHVADVLAERGHDVVPISRKLGVDIFTGDGLAEALHGVRCIIDAAGAASPDEDVATPWFATAARNLQQIGEQAGVRQLVSVSIIGCDRFSAGYMASKAAHERALRAGPVPVSIVRAAQFHEFVAQMLEWGVQGDVGYVPPMRTQLVAARSVAETVVDVATGAFDAASAHIEVAGPRVEVLATAARLLADRRGLPLTIEEIDNPADPSHALYENGALLPGGGAVLAGPTFAEWLDAAS